MNWYLEVWKKFAVFQGRSRRKEYWLFALFNVLAIAVLTLIDTMIGTFNMQAGVGVLSGVYCIAVLLPSLAVGVRRLHDIGKSGWWLLLGLVPLVGGI